MAHQDGPSGYMPARSREQSGIASSDNQGIHIAAWTTTRRGGGVS